MYRLLFLFSLFISLNSFAQKVKVACVGNSVTWGYLLPNRETECYPYQLGKMLGDSYEVKNFGVSGATLLEKGHRPYIIQEFYKEALAYKPDVVVISLGLNDTDPRNWPNYMYNFIPDYHKLIDSFRQANPTVDVWICKVSPIFSWHPRFKSSTRDWYWQVQNAIEAVAKATNSPLIDLYTPLHNRPELFKDALHPNAEGAAIIAKTVYAHLSKDWGGLRLAAPFSDHMVLQREKPLSIWGKANAGDTVVVSIMGMTVKSVASPSGDWMVTLPKQKAGGPYSMTVTAKEQTAVLKDIFIGEVWLCSGQSNMQFPLKSAYGAANDIENASNANVRLLNFRPVAETNAAAWNDTTLRMVNELKYFAGKWEVSSPQSAKEFSAVAYYFGQSLSKKLGVPVGLVLNAVGGSPIESWIGRYELEHSAKNVDILNNWDNNDLVQPWVRERCKQNIASASNPLQRHPFHPSYLFEAGIEPIIPMAMRGVIWYQGESNAHNKEAFNALFTEWVDCWRSRWKEELPIGYVQLSSLNRPSWPMFRDEQRRLLSARPRLGMVVCSDLGDSTDVHPTRKKEVGERLTLWALSECCGQKGTLLSPLFKSVEYKGSEALISFDNAKGLRSSDGKELREFEIAGEDRLFYPAKAVLKGDKLSLRSSLVLKPMYVRYGWKPYSRANLVNSANLPASSFTTEY